MKPTICCIIISGVFCGSIYAGELTPSAPPAPTMKTLSDVEPRTAIRQADIPLTISASGGSYYLAEPVSMSVEGTCITINGSDVTIDLNGYSITGPGGDSLIGSGITASTTNVTVKNGTVSGFGNDGIHLQHEATVSGVRAVDNNDEGIHTGKDCIIQNCIASRNKGDGFYGNGIIRNCVGAGNMKNGINVASFSFENAASVISENTCSTNGQNGIFVQAAAAAHIANNSCKSNSDTGIRCAAASVSRVEKNHVADNAAGVILGGADNVAFANTATGNGVDYNFGSGATYGPVTLEATGVMTTTNPWANIRY